jgi:hypothetical protein
MKKFLFTTLFFLLALSVGAVFGQSSFVENQKSIMTTGKINFFTHAVVDSVDTLYTNTFYGDRLANGIMTGRVLFTSVAGKPRIKVIRQSRFFTSWQDMKTLYTADSLETERNIVGDTLQTYGEHRFKIIGAAANRADVILKWLQSFTK